MHAMAGTGRVIAGRYRLKEPIGRGAMGTVWRGWDEILDREIAVKELRISDSLPEEERAKAYQRTHREARTAARLSHPGLVTVFDVAEEDGVPWIVMELVNARSLDQIIAQDGPLAPPRAAEAGRQLLSALAAAHAAGVLHRDVKPSNVLLTEAGRAVLTDFGIATFAGDPRLTQTGMVMGSPGFTAPERIQGNSATPASDLWSLGATLYAAVEGHGPFDKAGGAITTMSAIINNDPPTAPIAAGLGTVIDGLLKRNPAERPDAVTAARMLGAIGPLPDGAGISGYTPTASSYSPVLPRQPESGVASGSPAGSPGAGSAAEAAATAADPKNAGAGGAGAIGGLSVAAGALGAAGLGGADVAAGANGVDGADGSAGVSEVGVAPGASGAGVNGAGTNGAGTHGAGPAAAAGTSVDTPSREEQGSAGGAGAAGPPAPRSGSAPAGWASPPSPNGTPWPTAAAEDGPPGKTAAVPPPPGTLAAGSPGSRGPGAPAGGKRRRTMLIALGVVIILIAAAAAVFLTRSTGSGHSSASQSGGSSSGSTLAKAKTPVTAIAGTASTGTPPNGWHWYTLPASQAGTNAGFKVAIPDSWQVADNSSQRESFYLEAPGNDTFLNVDLTQHTKSSMVAEAHYLAHVTQEQGKFPGYANQSIQPINTRNFRGAAWSFTWQNPKLGRVRALDLMFIAQTSAGQQSYALYMSSPDDVFNANLASFTQEMLTFQPVP
jgi:tRNA A-37 threonylcarbamoyl transferase component Bud32